ncbi:chemotaxis protein CheA [Sphingorhabdus sp. IMCC26285]|uniref:Chemotaxis protein CheA n=1 Tax=Sphingorhabdus profundilacus TaxID=2509718 RepID=A0A6I4M4H1_9SPHN|nr:ATP-binding protein [Sphingorhabdus profundilacus]MVZ97205.1 chemotaxis protein CheA [Sphingorhabdus profundilacus]
MDELLDDFIAETRETLETLAWQLVQWEKNPQDRTLIDSVFRFVHTVKGSCGFLDLPRLLRLSHAAEDVLSCARDGQIIASPALVSAILAVVDRIAALTEALESGRALYDDDAHLIDAMLGFLPSQRTQDGADVIIDSELPDDAGIFAAAGPAKSRTVRVSLNLLDRLMSGVSDMVLARNEVSRQLRKSQTGAEVDHAFARLSASVAEMRDAVGLMRMQNIDRLFSSLPRLLRDISIELGKDVELRIEGSEVEVDREMVEALRDPLKHILRNAVDHGIETADERMAAGKNPKGQIQIVARQSGNQILIEIIDDGRGIDLEKLGSRAIAAKIATAADWQIWSEKAKLNTIFVPGLSTAQQVTSISGRGVGMDIVRSNLQVIGGTVDLENFEGQGLKMTLRLPLTLSIIAGLSIKAGDQFFGVSRSSVVEILSATNKNVKIEELGGISVAHIRGQRYPYARLEELLDIGEVVDSSPVSRTLIVIKPAIGATYVLDVESVIDNEELVVKPGAPIIMATGLYAGTTLPDNGRPMLLLDTSGLGAAIGVEQVQDDGAGKSDEIVQQTIKRPSALLFIATNGVKRAIRLNVVDRIEDIDVADITFVGGKMRAKIADRLYDICELDSIADTGQIKLLRLSDGQNIKFLAVEDVLDIFTLDGEIYPSAQPEIFEGVVMAQDESVELVNIYHYFETCSDVALASNTKALCFIGTVGDAEWEKRILAPLLTASGYAVSFDDADRKNAAIVLCRGSGTQDIDDTRTLHLRDTVHASQMPSSSIYRYDRIGLLSAIELKLAGAA